MLIVIINLDDVISHNCISVLFSTISVLIYIVLEIHIKSKLQKCNVYSAKYSTVHFRLKMSVQNWRRKKGSSLLRCKFDPIYLPNTLHRHKRSNCCWKKSQSPADSSRKPSSSDYRPRRTIGTDFRTPSLWTPRSRILSVATSTSLGTVINFLNNSLRIIILIPRRIKM